MMRGEHDVIRDIVMLRLGVAMHRRAPNLLRSQRLGE
jgi:hypothetical protein